MTDDHETLRRKFRDDIEANWATLSPAFRAAHNQLRQARGQLPIPPPKVDLYVAPSKAAGSADPVNPASVPADTAAKTKARRGVAAVKLKHPLKHRASRDTYSPAMMRLMLRYYGLALPEIEHILHLASPNKDLREALAGRLWDYLRGIAGKDGSGRERPAETAHYAARLHELVQPLRDLLQQLVYAPDHDQSAGMIVINLFAEGIKPVELLDQLEHLLRVTQSVTKSRGGQQPDYDHHVLMRHVADIYERTTGERPSVSWDEAKGVYSGRLLRMAALVDAVAARAAKRSPKTNSALGQRLQDVCGARRPYGGNPPV
jgi:hypothetical protein